MCNLIKQGVAITVCSQKTTVKTIAEASVGLVSDTAVIKLSREHAKLFSLILHPRNNINGVIVASFMLSTSLVGACYNF